MKHLQQWPLPLQRRWLLSCIIGLGYLLVGIIMYITAKDQILLTISILLTVLTAIRCTVLYRQIGREAYEVIEGVCIKLKKAPLRKQRSLCLLTDTGTEHSLTLGEKTPICIGHRYRFFYLLSESNAAFIHAHQFLALEDLGEFTANYEEFENNSK